MSKSKDMISEDTIKKFLDGTDPQQYIVAIEGNYHSNTVELVINPPEGKKYIESQTYKPFLWFKHEVSEVIYGGKRHKILEACAKHGVKITKLKINNEGELPPERLSDGFMYMAKCSKSYNDLINFFKFGGVDVFGQERAIDSGLDNKVFFTMFSPVEQFMIQTGKRLFKGFEDYDELHRFQFDLETEGLYANRHEIFQIGMRDNDGNHSILETIGDTPQERRDSERRNIETFFAAIDMLEPDIVTGYNSENFDWAFIFERCKRLNINIESIAKTLSPSHKIKRKKSPIKLGGKSEFFDQTLLYGINVIDISHAVRRAMAINSEIKSWGLKYITKYSEVASKNRVYVPGDKIRTTWADKVNSYAFNNENGDWYKISERNPLKEEYVVTTGAEIVKKYLMDDLIETDEIDKIFNQASFLIGKILPTTFQRSSTMGTAGQWKLIMAAWSYENGLALPSLQTKRDFTGGLSRLLRVGFSKNFVKLDFAALYPKTELTWDIFPELDITGVMKGMLTYIVNTRDKFKNLTSYEKDIVKKLKKELEDKTLTPEERKKKEEEINDHKKLQNKYDKKQLPLKILANSWFGSYGAPYIFNWGDSDCAEETTCRGRQYLRLMVRFFKDEYGFTPLVLDTDGCNFELPDNIEERTYTIKGNHWKTKDKTGEIVNGIEAALADFNENHLPIGSYMGLDIDDVGNASINFSRKNYANDIGGKIKLVGNSVKSSKMPAYIEDFLEKGIRLLLDDKGYEFIELYYDYVDKIYGYAIPLVKIASKSQVTTSMSEYKAKANKKNKAGKPMPKQAHMELAIREGLELNKGDMLYYVNTGESKSCGDLKTDTNKETGARTVTLNCKLIDPMVIERDNEMIKELAVLRTKLKTLTENDTLVLQNTKERIDEIENSLSTHEYNAGKYLTAFNKKVEPLLVCFSPEIREEILLGIVTIKDKATKTKTEQLKPRNAFTREQCKLISGKPYEDVDQDTYDDLMTMEDKEIRFWDSVNKIPNEMEESEWKIIRADYKVRMIKAREEGIIAEKNRIDDIFKRLELKDYQTIEKILKLIDDKKIESNTEILPTAIRDIVEEKTEESDSDFGFFVSKKWGVRICPIDDLFKYKEEAIERDRFYNDNVTLLSKIKNKDEKYERWLLFKSTQLIMTGNTIGDGTTVDIVKTTIKLPKTKVSKPVKEVKKSSDDSDDEEETNDDGKIIGLDDSFDDTMPDKPDDYIPVVNTTIIEPKSIETKPIVVVKEEIKKVQDEWGF